jgi:hypothetical protein
MDVQFIRLKTGEDLITEVEETETSCVFINPCKVLYLKSPKTGFLTISLMQWVFTKICSEQYFEVDKSEILFRNVPNESMIEHYWNSVEHFTKTETESNVEFDDSELEDDVDDISSEESLELIKKLLEIKTDKGSLH